MRNFYRFEENNDWEGETWYFYVPVDGNEKAIQALKDSPIINSDITGYEISDRLYTEDEVNVLENTSDVGYLQFHNKLNGKLDLSGIDLSDHEAVEDAFYKGGIEKFSKS